MKSAFSAVLHASLLFVGMAAGAAPDAALEQRAAAAVSTLSGTLELPGLRAPVDVQRDRWGVAHIYAADAHDLFFAQGFVVAQDRLFQMELWKRAGQGRLAEILGASALMRDVNARRLRYRGDMQAEYASYAPDARAILESFTAGINAFIDRSLAAGGHLPLEFELAGFKPEHWKPEDCLNRLAAYSMMNNASDELLHAQLVSLLGVDAASRLFMFDPAVRLEPAPGLELAGLTPKLLENVVSSDRRIPFPASTMQESNNWTVAGALTASGKPILANDPHRVIAQPSLRYIVHLVAPGWNVIGAGEPGLPGVAAGHNEHIAWGFTIFGLDQQDLYVETLDAHDPKRYRTSQGWRTMTVKSETIAVRGAPAVQVELKFTRHGPVLWDDGKRALALRWVGSEAGTAGYLGSLSLDRARNWQEFERAMPRWKVPSENIVYADRDGNIGEHSTGLAPVRRNFTGLLPMPGDAAFEWQGFVPNAQLPHSFNPQAGFIATANHKTIAEDYPFAVGFVWGAPNRFQRIHDVLENDKLQGHKITVADMQALQTDVVSLVALRLQPLLQRAVIAAGPQLDPRQRSLADLLINWNGALTADSPQAALYEIWSWELRNAVTQAAVPAAARAAMPRWGLDQAVHELSDARSTAFGADAVQGRNTLLLDTLRAAGEKLAARQGGDTARWRWGGLHAMTFRHALDALPGAAALLDRGPVERSGDGDVVQSTAYENDGFDQASGASYREIFDLSDWDAAMAINVPGQSGQPGARHFDDLVPLWSEGRYFPLEYSKAAVDAVTTDRLRLTP
jgi:penicillin amidase